MTSLVIDSGCKEFTLISKWGFDGASNQANYKQKVQTNDEQESFVGTANTIPGNAVEKLQMKTF